MALRVARGMFRLWLILSVLWIGLTGYFLWQTLAANLRGICYISELDGRPDDCSWLSAALVGREDIMTAILFAVALPAFVLALGSVLAWAFKVSASPETARMSLILPPKMRRDDALLGRNC